MGWLSMTASGMAPHATPKAYLDAQFTFPPDPDKGRTTGLRVLKSSILDLLDPPRNEHAAQWREHCRQRLALTSRRKPRPGDTLVLAESLTFTDGQSERTFRVVASGKKTRLCRMSDGVGVRITNLMSRAWTIVPPPAAPHLS